eukprot:1496191-Alexandrium_andersonii.AAC.1
MCIRDSCAHRTRHALALDTRCARSSRDLSPQQTQADHGEWRRHRSPDPGRATSAGVRGGLGAEPLPSA